ncbi:formin-like protein 11 [Phtheirospermum japonicum]|uniref:Formin-like protein n=1 Tax=Phtheirospermum japonicum TaxID=374723 RepID=A0A830BL70_9LAMI|nr:formin-like protein 11 [Phtheirospermum japonicum]
MNTVDDITFPVETNSSDDDQSFHSFCDSRLSNASACSSTLGETSEIIISQETHCSQLQPSHFSQTTKKQAAIPPPPPCPPPLSKTHNLLNFLKAPPPPPPQLNQQVPLGKDGSPLPKLKPLHWDKVRAAPNRSTVWDKLRSSSFEFDEEMIESLFGYNLQNPTLNDEAKSKTPSPSKHVLDRKRLQNITILSKALSVTAEQVCVALIRGTGDGLALQDLEALSKMVPTKEEECKLANYKGEIFELGSAEKLVMGMLKIPFGFSRIEAMLYRETFEDEVLHLQKSFSMLEEACMELRSSRLFLKLLEAVLKTGNRMNVGTIRGGARAFKLDTLLKLADVKGTDGKTTLLHFVVQEIIRSEGLRVSESIMEDKEENYRRMGLDLVSGLSTELCNAKKTATIDLGVLASSVANLSDGMQKLQDLVHKDMIMVDKRGSFVTSMISFLNYAEMKLKELHEDENRVLSHVREITEYFHGDVSKDESNPLQIFVIVRDFLSMLDNVCKELRSSKAPRSPNPLAPFR